MRGGSRITPAQSDTTKDIINFIKKLTVSPSHYGRGNSNRQYLSPELSIAKLYRRWSDERVSANLPTASLQKFTKTFKNNFNLAFIPPKVDVCSYCDTLEAQIRLNIEVDESKALLDLHKSQSKRFYELLRESAADEDILCVTFDMQQNQQLPKTNVGEAYYSRQIALYNLTFVVHKPKHIRPRNVFIYTWLESDLGKGSNEVISALDHFFKKVIQPRIARRRYKMIKLFSDCCPAQNKNSTMLGYLLRKMEDPTVYKFVRDIEYVFPIRGHSFLPADQVFAHIEKRLRKITVIKTPAEYHEVYDQFGTVFVYGDDWVVYDFKTLAETCLKPINQLKMQKNRKWLFTRKKPGTVAVNNSYWGEYTSFELKKPEVGNFFIRLPKLVPSKSHVTEKKAADVKKLIRLVDLTDREKEFYNTELSKPCLKRDDTLNPVVINLKKTTTKRKVVNEEDDTSKRKRGRPKKTETPKGSNFAANESEVSEPTPSTSKAIVVPVKKRGRPKKNNNGKNQD